MNPRLYLSIRLSFLSILFSLIFIITINELSCLFESSNIIQAVLNWKTTVLAKKNYFDQILVDDEQLAYCYNSGHHSRGMCGKQFSRNLVEYLTNLRLLDFQTAHWTEDSKTLNLKPTYVTAFSSNHYSAATDGILKSFRKQHHTEQIIVYDLGMEQIELRQVCPGPSTPNRYMCAYVQILMRTFVLTFVLIDTLDFLAERKSTDQRNTAIQLLKVSQFC